MNASGQEEAGAGQDPSRSSLAFKLAVGGLYAGIFVVGVLGNALVCWVVARNRAMQTVTNLFITNLALSDILLCVLAVPFTPLYTFLGSWVFGDALCHLVPYAQGVSVYISSLTLTGIALDRFLVIVYPFRARMRLPSCGLAILAIWACALLLTLPYGLYVQPQGGYCEEAWPDEPFRMAFSSLTSVLQFVLPFLVIALCYVCVSLRLRERARHKPGSKSSATSRREAQERERKRRTNRMLIAMVAIFGLSWLPLNLVNVVEDFHPPAIQLPYYKVLFFVAHCLAMSSTCYNPFLYAWLNDNFRKEFKLVLPCFGERLERAATGLERSERTCCNRPEQTTLQESLLPSASPPGELISLQPQTGVQRLPLD